MPHAIITGRRWRSRIAVGVATIAVIKYDTWKIDHAGCDIVCSITNISGVGETVAKDDKLGERGRGLSEKRSSIAIAQSDEEEKKKEGRTVNAQHHVTR